MPSLDLPAAPPRRRAAAPAAVVEPAEVPATNPTTEEPVNENYVRLVKETAELIGVENQRTLEFYHTLGDRVNELVASPDNYGGKKVEGFSRDLAVITKIKLGTSSLYKAAKFNEHCNKTMLVDLIGMGVSWRNVTFLFSAELPDADRKALISRSKSGELTQDQLMKAVIEKVGVSGKRAGGRKPIMVLGKVTSMSRVVKERLLELDSIFKKIADAKASTKAQYREAVHKFKDEAEELIKEVRTRLLLINKIEFEEPAEK